MSLTQQQELELLTNNIKTKIGALRLRGDNVDDFEELFEDYEKNGTTMLELRLLHEDVLRAWNEFDE